MVWMRSSEGEARRSDCSRTRQIAPGLVRSRRRRPSALPVSSALESWCQNPSIRCCPQAGTRGVPAAAMRTADASDPAGAAPTGSGTPATRCRRGRLCPWRPTADRRAARVAPSAAAASTSSSSISGIFCCLKSCLPKPMVAIFHVGNLVPESDDPLLSSGVHWGRPRGLPRRSQLWGRLANGRRRAH